MRERIEKAMQDGGTALEALRNSVEFSPKVQQLREKGPSSMVKKKPPTKTDGDDDEDEESDDGFFEEPDLDEGGVSLSQNPF